MTNKNLYVAIIYCAPAFYVNKESKEQYICSIKVSFNPQELHLWVKENKTKFTVKKSRVQLINPKKMGSLNISEDNYLSFYVKLKGSIMNDYKPQTEFISLPVPQSSIEWVKNMVHIAKQYSPKEITEL